MGDNPVKTLGKVGFWIIALHVLVVIVLTAIFLAGLGILWILAELFSLFS